jgi:hypothetical protein
MAVVRNPVLYKTQINLSIGSLSTLYLPAEDSINTLIMFIPEKDQKMDPKALPLNLITSQVFNVS